MSDDRHTVPADSSSLEGGSSDQKGLPTPGISKVVSSDNTTPLRYDPIAGFDQRKPSITELLETHLVGLAEKLDGLEVMIQSSESIEGERKEKQLNDLVDELKILRNGAYNQKADSLIESLITLHLHFQMTINESLETDTRSLESLCRELERILQAHGVNLYSDPQPGRPFNPERQKALEVEDTLEADLDGTVAELLNVGFEAPDRIIRYESVKVYRYAGGPQS